MLWQALKEQKETLDDSGLINFFEQSGLQVLAEMIRNWDILQ
jgi:hypothetical protein